MTSTGREGCAPMTPDLIARLRSQIAQSEAYYEHAHIRPSPWMGMMAEAADQLEALRSHAEAMRKAIIAFLPRNVSIDNDTWADGTLVPLDTNLGELRALKSSAAAYRSAFPEVG